jgi:ubiquinone/menaquinone biosynthesis C-methylase UbiE
MHENAVTTSSTQAGQAPYSRSALLFYDLFVMHYTLPVLWRCSSKRLRRLYDEHAGDRHLDVGVGSGYLLDKCRFRASAPRITLMDMNPNSLSRTARRIRRYSPVTHQGDVLEPWGVPAGSFDSVAMSNLLHCLPGDLREKAAPIEEAHEALTPGGTLFGATVLGLEADQTKRSRKALERLNRKGAFNNLDDRAEDLDAALAEAFSEHSLEIEGAVALFTAHKVEESEGGTVGEAR